MGDVPYEDFITMNHFKVVGKYARFRGAIKKCTDQGSLQVQVVGKGFDGYPIDAGVGGAMGCTEVKP
jgi:hypothetical protein